MTFEPQSEGRNDDCLCPASRLFMQTGSKPWECCCSVLGNSKLSKSDHNDFAGMASGLPIPDSPSWEAGLLCDSRYGQVD